MPDQDYIALVQIERRLANEISSLSMSGNQFLEYARAMESSSLGINGTLKALRMFGDLYRRTQKEEMSEPLDYWTDALLEAAGNPEDQKLFESIDFSEPLASEFSALKSHMDRMKEKEMRFEWLILILAALFASGLMALLVLGAGWNFAGSMVLCAGLYFAVIWWYFAIELPRRKVRELKKMRRKLKGRSARFLKTVRLKEYPFPFWKKEM